MAKALLVEKGLGKKIQMMMDGSLWKGLGIKGWVIQCRLASTRAAMALEKKPPPLGGSL